MPWAARHVASLACPTAKRAWTAAIDMAAMKNFYLEVSAVALHLKGVSQFWLEQPSNVGDIDLKLHKYFLITDPAYLE